MKTVPYRRSVLADILDRIRQDLADRVPPEEIERRLAGYPDLRHPEEIERRLAGYPDLRHPEQILFAYNTIGWPALAPLEKCEHEPHTDNCLACAPRWGWRGPKAVAK
jgi:hypothetical protein